MTLCVCVADVQEELLDLARDWVTVFEKQKGIYGMMQQLLWQMGNGPEALIWSERGRSRALLSQLLASPSAREFLESIKEFDQDEASASDVLSQGCSACGENALCIEYAVTRQGLFAYAVRDGKVIATSRHGKADGSISSYCSRGGGIPGGVQLLAAETLQLIRGASIGDEVSELTEKLSVLYQVLMEPFEDVLKTAEMLIIIPHEVS